MLNININIYFNLSINFDKNQMELVQTSNQSHNPVEFDDLVLGGYCIHCAPTNSK